MQKFKTLWLLSGLLLISTAALAHVPYLEETDSNASAPFKCPYALQSIAVYSWLQSDTDVDFYTFNAYTCIPFYAGLIVPVFDVYAEFRPSMALIGQGLPDPGELLPVPLAPGEGAIVLHDASLEPRPQFLEPFGNKSYYQGPELNIKLKPGEYRLIYWDPKGIRGTMWQRSASMRYGCPRTSYGLLRSRQSFEQGESCIYHEGTISYFLSMNKCLLKLRQEYQKLEFESS